MNVQNVIKMAEKTFEGSLLERIEQLIANGISAAKIARESGLADSALSRWRKGKYEGDNQALEEKLVAWLDNQTAREEMRIPEPPPWVDTPTAQKILTVLRYAQMMKAVAPIYGAAGVGKTHTAEYYAAHWPNIWIATMSPDTASIAAAMEEIAYAVGLPGAKGRAARIRREIVRKIKGTAGLLILDDAQHLTIPTLEAVRRIFDTSDIGLALIGNETVYTNLTGGSRDADFARLYSRIGNRLYVKKVGSEDVKNIASAWGISGASEIRELLKIAAPEDQMKGGIRAMTYTLQLAVMAAQGGVGQVKAEHIRGAAKRLEVISE